MRAVDKAVLAAVIAVTGCSSDNEPLIPDEGVVRPLVTPSPRERRVGTVRLTRVAVDTVRIEVVGSDLADGAVPYVAMGICGDTVADWAHGRAVRGGRSSATVTFSDHHSGTYTVELRRRGRIVACAEFDLD